MKKKYTLDLQQQVRNELIRRSLGHFHTEGFKILHGGEQMLPGRHIDAMVHALEQVARGDIKRLIITLPPRHGKSELVSGSFPAWILGQDPAAKITITSYGLDLSTQLADKARTIIKDPAYQRLFPATIIRPGKDRADHFVTSKRGEVRAASKAGAMTGMGTHILIVDDFHKAGETLSPVEREKAIETFRSTFFTRFDNLENGRIIIVMQRLHEDDLVGWALDHGNWHHLNLPAFAVQDEIIPLSRGDVWHRKKGDVLAPNLASREYLEQQRAAMGDRYFQPQFQQDPEAAGGGQIDLAWFGQFDEMPPRTFFHKIVQSWDPAITERVTSDYSVGMTWGFRDGKWYLLDLIRVKIAFNTLLDRVLAWHRKWRTDALIIEGASIGIALFEQVKRARLPGIIRAPSPRLSKEDRLAACTPQLETGDFLLPASAPWLTDLRRELLSFPDSKNDDQVDALVQFVEFTFRDKSWVDAEFDAKGRRMRIPRRSRRPQYYGGDTPSSTSWRG
ncbi:MAG: phage terminase large subunit [Pseudomonadota bacterium]